MNLNEEKEVLEAFWDNLVSYECRVAISSEDLMKRLLYLLHRAKICGACVPELNYKYHNNLYYKE